MGYTRPRLVSKMTISSRRGNKTSRPKAKAKAKPAAKPKRPKKPKLFDDPVDLARMLAGIALDRKGEDVLVLDVRKLTSIADYFLIVTGTNSRHVSAIADQMMRAIKAKGRKSIGDEGLEKGHWALVDYGDVVVHVFLEEVRDLYQLERLWMEAPEVTVEAKAQKV